MVCFKRVYFFLAYMFSALEVLLGWWVWFLGRLSSFFTFFLVPFFFLLYTFEHHWAALFGESASIACIKLPLFIPETRYRFWSLYIWEGEEKGLCLIGSVLSWLGNRCKKIWKRSGGLFGC